MSLLMRLSLSYNDQVLTKREFFKRVLLFWPCSTNPWQKRNNSQSAWQNESLLGFQNVLQKREQSWSLLKQISFREISSKQKIQRDYRSHFKAVENHVEWKLFRYFFNAKTSFINWTPAKRHEQYLLQNLLAFESKLNCFKNIYFRDFNKPARCK